MTDLSDISQLRSIVSRLGLATCDGNGIRKEIVNDIVQDSETDYVSAV